VRIATSTGQASAGLTLSPTAVKLTATLITVKLRTMASILDSFARLQNFPALVAALSSNPALAAEISALKTDPGHIAGPVVIPNCAQVRLFWLLGNGKTATNVLHGSYTATFNPSVSMANALMASCVAGLTSSALAGQLHNSTSLFAVGLRDISAAHTTEYISTSAAGPGTGTGTALPPQTAFVVTLRTGTAGQGGRGRVYLPGYASSADVGNGTANSTVTTASPQFITTVSAGMNALTTPLAFCLARPARAAYTGKTGTAHAARQAGTLPITAIVAENVVWDTQRRRSEP
jgi:hypothetical protein